MFSLPISKCLRINFYLSYIDIKETSKNNFVKDDQNKDLNKENITKISPFRLDPIVIEERPKIEEKKAGKALTEVDKSSEFDEEEKLVHTDK
jgi:hypothetical protein